MQEPLDQSDKQPARPNWTFGKIVLGNLGILLAYIVLGGIFLGGASDGLHIISIVIQVALNLFAGLGAIFSSGYRKIGLAFLLSGLLVAMIGPGMCGYDPEIISGQEERPGKPI